MKWGEQQPDTIHPLEIIRCMRTDVMDGYFNMKDWDHGSPNYEWPRSNKAMRIAGCTISGDPDLSHSDALKVVFEVAFGFRH